MIVKPSISFLNDDPDPVLLTDTDTITSAMTNNPNYTTPAPTLAAVTAAAETFAEKLAAAATGGVQQTSEKNAARAVLTNLLRQLASYVQVACDGDMAKLQSSGFPIQKPQRQPIGTLPAPSNLRVSLGGRSGELDARVSPLYGAGSYNWKVVATNAPTVVVQMVQTTAASITITGLTPCVEYSVQANAVGSAGPSDWTDAASQIVI